MTDVHRQRVLYEDVKYWLWASQNQLGRLRQSFDRQMNSFSITQELEYTAEYPRFSAQTYADIHFLLIATSNLIKATNKRRLPPEVKDKKLDIHLVDKIEHLRNIHEHWEGTRGAFTGLVTSTKSAKWYIDNYPNKTPWSLALDENGSVVCGILNINELEVALGRLESALVAHLPPM